MAYDGQHRLLAATNAANEQVFRSFYDFCGNLTNRVDGAGRNIRRQFDVLNRCTNTVYSDGSSEAFTFDAAGNLLSAKNAATTNAFGYDAMNRLTSAVSRAGSVAFTNLYRRDVGGLATNVVYPGGNVVRYLYDAEGRVTNVTDWANHSWRITRDAAGRMTGMTYPNGIAGAWGYDASHAVVSWNYTGTSNLPGRTITRNTVGLKTREDITGPMPQGFANRRAVNTFNNADRLTSAQVTLGTNVFAENYLYDGCGALTNVTRGTGTNDVFSYDPAGRLVSTMTTNSLQSTTGSVFSCAYDALGNRVRTSVNGTNRLWVVDHSDPLKRPLMETTTNGVPVRYYIWGAGRLLGVIESNNTFRCVLCDDMGSVVALTDAGGNVTDTFSYGPYGENWGRTGTNSIPFGWQGGHGVFHVAGDSLYLTRYRAYDTTLKRFLSPDPMGLGGGANLYGYANGNPLSYIDPLGLCGESVAGAALRGFGDYFTSSDYSANMNQACSDLINLPANAVAGTAGYIGKLSGDFSGTLNGTFNDPSNAIQNYDPAREFESWLGNPSAIFSSVIGGATLALGFAPGAAAGDAMALGSSENSLVTVTHFTDATTVGKIVNGSGTLNAGSFVTLPSQVTGLSASGVESALEIGTGKGAFSTTFQTPASNLGPAFNGPFTSGQKLQWQLINPARPGPFVPTP